MQKGCVPGRAPATVKHKGDGEVGVSGVGIKRQSLLMIKRQRGSSLVYGFYWVS